MGVRREGGSERPRAVSEYLVERMIARRLRTKLCFVISPRKNGHSGATTAPGFVARMDIAYVVQPRAARRSV